jgi:hypothetical protein
VGEINEWMFVDQRIVVACGLKFYVFGKCCAFNKMTVAFTNIKRLTLGKRRNMAKKWEIHPILVYG